MSVLLEDVGTGPVGVWEVGTVGASCEGVESSCEGSPSTTRSRRKLLVLVEKLDRDLGRGWNQGISINGTPLSHGNRKWRRNRLSDRYLGVEEMKMKKGCAECLKVGYLGTGGKRHF